MSGIVAIVGRPNVGKSTFFNRMIGTRKAIVDEFSGVTRDRQYGKSDWNGKSFDIIDTGGLVEGSDDIFDQEINKQVHLAIEEAKVLIFMVDVMTGITDLDLDVAELLRKSDKPVFLVANKVDIAMKIAEAAEFYQLGLGEVFCVSAINGSGTGELLDEIVKHLDEDIEEEENEIPRYAVVGRPNAGKSSFINRLVGEERNIVTPIAGTTRDVTDIHYKAFGHEFVLVDTAGIRKKSKVHEDLEFYSVMRAINALERADVCFLMIDANEGFSTQDLNILGLCERNNKGVIILLNKWDLVTKDTQTEKMVRDKVIERIKPFTDIDILTISVKEKKRVLKALELGKQVHENRTQKIKTRELNDELLPVIQHTPPPATKGKYIKIKYITQLPTHSPSFAFYCNLPQYVKEPYKRFLENQIRDRWDFTGVPIRIFIRKK